MCTWSSGESSARGPRVLRSGHARIATRGAAATIEASRNILTVSDILGHFDSFVGTVNSCDSLLE